MPIRESLKWTLIGVAVLMVSSILYWGVTVGLLLLRAPSIDDYVATCESASNRLPLAIEVEKLFPGMTDHFITHYGINRFGGERTNLWNSESHFYGRYSLTMQVEVIVDYTNNTVTPAGKPTFYLVEYTRIDDLGGGQLSGTSDGAGATFGEEEWRKIYDTNGDFSVVGMTTRKNVPVPNFEKFVAATRAPRVPVSLLNDRIGSH